MNSRSPQPPRRINYPSENMSQILKQITQILFESLMTTMINYTHSKDNLPKSLPKTKNK